VAEFKTMVRALHRAGLKVILDVVYNHTGEGSELGPTLSFRGIDNTSYYSLTGPPEAPGRYYMNYTGCGNSLDFDSPVVLRLVMDSLRYWMEQMHVDGFRFDLASVLGRRALDGGFQPTAPFFDAVAQDPVLARAILIAEPWDLGTYQVGNFPIEWAEWNGRFRDTVRRFVKGDAGQVPDLARRVTGSADLYGDDGRSAFNGVNFVTCHDGFTLHDLVAYDTKHNEANGEDNRDGASDNHSWNCGVEGPTDDPAVLALRRRLARNHACALLFAAGTPMLLGGDEFLRTQRGNNNAYGQDNPISWFDWQAAARETDMQAFVRKAIALTRRFPILQRRKFLLGKDLDADRIADVTWFGAELGPPSWLDPELRTLCYQLDGGEELAAGRDYLLFVILHAHWEPRSILLPKLPTGRRWLRVVDTSLPPGEDIAEPGREVSIDPPDHYLASPICFVAALDRALNVQAVRLAPGLRATPRSLTLLAGRHGLAPPVAGGGAARWDAVAHGRAERPEQGLGLRAERSLPRVDDVEAPAQRLGVTDLDGEEPAAANLLHDGELGQEGQPDASLDHPLGRLDRLDFQHHVRDEPGPPEEPVGERPVARAAVEEDQGLGSDLVEPRAPGPTHGPGRRRHQHQRVVAQADRLDLGMVQRAGQAQLGLPGQHHAQDLLGVPRPHGDQRLGMGALEPLEHVGQQIGADRQHGGDGDGAAA
jgi:hypothetical protein